ncbi:unnamed protein product [Phaedon cochleariae]|uniref:Monocarboxylate transporter n=1 Tax=Phaedon cochleariae TaxID=80249 RepID=A0A9N9SDD8_PHACE|nr:unnamed protein product [Phaedon cochleariae]
MGAALLSYGLLLGVGAGIVRETSTLVLGHYFKRRREFVEMVAQSGTGVGIALFSVLYKEAVGAVQGYHGYVLFVWMYGVCLGGFSYSLKMFTLERVKGRHFTKAWGFIQGAKSVPVLIGIPITGYINQTYPKAGYYFSFVTTIIGASLMFLVGTRKDHTSILNSHSNSNLNNCSVTNLNLMNDCACPLVPYNGLYTPQKPSYQFCRQGSNNYERIFANYHDHFDKANYHRLSYRHKKDTPYQHHLPKSISYAANIDRSAYHPQLSSLCNKQDHIRYSSLPRMKRGATLRPSKSVPEGLARWEYCRTYRRPTIRNIQVIEQMTTSV